MVVSGMAKKNFSSKEISTKAVLKKAVVDKETSTEKITQKKEVKEVQKATKNKNNDPNRIELKKYCPWCRKHTVHKEVK